MWLLGIESGVNAWKCSQHSALRFGTLFGSRHHTVMAIRERDLTSAMDENSSADRSARVSHVEMYAGEVVLAWAITLLMDECTTQLVEARNVQL